MPRRPVVGLPGAQQFPFEEMVPEKTGIKWVHSSGKSPEKYLPESSGPGCAFLDYDNDGWMDIYLVNSGKCDFFTPNPSLRNALYKNNRDGTFTDVTEKAGVAAGGYGQGVAVGDYDRDGFPDMYVTQYGRSILYHNNGDGTFTDVTETLRRIYRLPRRKEWNNGFMEIGGLHLGRRRFDAAKPEFLFVIRNAKQSAANFALASWTMPSILRGERSGSG